MPETRRKSNMDNELTLYNTFTADGKIYSIEKKGEYMYIVRENGRTLSIYTNRIGAESKFNRLKAQLARGGEKNMGGYEAAKAKADELKAENVGKEESKALAEQELKSQLVRLQENGSLAKLYADNANIGADNLAGELPLLKIHSVGKSSKNELADGSEPHDGYLFYKPTGEEFKTIDCHILTISRGFYAKGLEENKPDVFNQIIAGVFGDKNEMPFMMYMTGLKLSYMWEFGKQAKQYTHGRPVAIPMFAMTIRLTTEQIENKFGKSWIVNFEILKDESGYPQLVMDEGEFIALRDTVETSNNTIAGLIAKKETKGNGVMPSEPADAGVSDYI